MLPYTDTGGYPGSISSDVGDNWTDGSVGHSDFDSNTGYLESSAGLSDSNFESDTGAAEGPGVSQASAGAATFVETMATPSAINPHAIVSSSVPMCSFRIPNIEPCQSCKKRPVDCYCIKCGEICSVCWLAHPPDWHSTHVGIPISEQSVMKTNLGYQSRNAKRVREEEQRRHLFIHNILSAATEKHRLELHKRDLECLWFAVRNDEKEDKSKSEESTTLDLEEYDGFNKIIDEHCQTYNVSTSECYPRVVSFIGDTGAGKSSLIRLHIEHAWESQIRPLEDSFRVPVIGLPSSSLPTSGNVHLYRDYTVDSLDKSSPLLYVDCEGFKGSGRGEFEEALKKEQDQGIISRSYNFVRRKLSGMTRRDYAVQELFPRLLYNFSDTVVYVVRSGTERQMESILENVLKWAHSSHSAAVNRVTLPHIIVVENQCDGNLNQEWEHANTTQDILRTYAKLVYVQGTYIAAAARRFRDLGTKIDCVEDLLLQSYSSIRFLRIPNLTSGLPLAGQLRVLHGMMDECTAESQARKAAIGMKLNAKSLEQFFHLAFNHYSADLHRPFNFLEALFAAQPPPESLFGRILYMMKRTFATLDRNQDVRSIASAFARIVIPSISSSIVLDADRSYGVHAGTLVSIYKGTLRQSSQTCEKSYESYVNRALEEFRERSVECCFKNTSNARCVNSFLAHKTLGRHQDIDGNIIGLGDFKSDLSDEIAKHWRSGMESSLQDLDKVLKTDATSRESVWAVHEKHLATLFGRPCDSPLDQRSICYWCIRNDATEILPCGHGICDVCIAAKGTASSRDPRAFDIYMCNLHSEEVTFRPCVSFLLLPRDIGRRILSIDGGGVRGLVSLKILAAIERRMGGDVPISAFFDLIGGSGSGGLAALVLGLKGWKMDALEETFNRAYKKVYSPKFNPARFFGHDYYEDYGSGDIIHETFGAVSRMRLLGSTNRELQGKWARVFVTTTREERPGGSVIANYPRCSSTGQSADWPETESFQVWEAVRATMAIPDYFPPLKRNDRANQDSFYYDGGAWQTNPSKTAIIEAGRIWPATENKGPDILLSVGNGSSKRKLTPNLRSSQQYRRVVRNLNSEDKPLEDLRPECAEREEKYFRFNPNDNGSPDLDDFEAMGNGELENIAKEYLENGITQHNIKHVFYNLLATSFYFHPTEQVNEKHAVILKGSIKCRCKNGSELAKKIAEHVQKLQKPQFKCEDDHSFSIDLHSAMPKMLQEGILELEDIALRFDAVDDPKYHWFPEKVDTQGH
ncbi:Phospholipase A I [Metarhizium anisopliae]